MPEYITIKLRDGSDLVGIREFEYDDVVRIINPVQINIHPEHGFFAKSWLLLNKTNAVTLSKSDILILDDASDKAIKYYEEFLYQIGSRDEEKKVAEDDRTLEDIFTSLLESKISIKH